MKLLLYLSLFLAAEILIGIKPPGKSVPFYSSLSRIVRRLGLWLKEE